MILEDEQIQNRITLLRNQIEAEKRIIEIAEPFEMLLDNEYFKKIQGYYEESSDNVQKTIDGLSNDLVNDGAVSDNGLPENPVFHQLRIANIIGKSIVQRDVLRSFFVEPASIVKRAKGSQEIIDKLSKEIAGLEETNA